MKRYGFHLITLALLILSLNTFISDLSGSPFVNRVKELSSKLTLPVINAKERIFLYVEDKVSRYIVLVALKEENIRLRRELERCGVEEAELNTYRRTLSRLGEELGIGSLRSFYGLSFSRIMYYDPSGSDSFVIVSAGRQSGVNRNDVVLSKGSVIGLVKEVHTTTSKVITTFSGNLNLSVLLEPSGKSYIYRGGYPEGELLYVNRKDKVKVGDRVLYRDPKGRVPNFVVGYVSSVEEGDSPFFKRVSVTPAVNPRSIELVVILTGGER